MKTGVIVGAAALLSLSACGGGGGGGISYGPSPDRGLTLAQVSSGDFSSSRNSGGIGKSMRYREPDQANGVEATTARIVDDQRKLIGIQFTTSSDTGLIHVVANEQITRTPLQLQNGIYVSGDVAYRSLEMKALDLGSYNSVLGGLWEVIPEGPNVQTFVGGWHAGSLTPDADLPTGTNVVFTGNVIGRYVRNDNAPGGNTPLTISEVTGNASIEFDFTTGTIVEGANSAIFNLVLTDLPAETLNELSIVNDGAIAIDGATWDAALEAVNQTGDSTDFSASARGDISGRFYGPGGGTQEMGSAFRMREDNESEIFVGVILATN